MKQNLVGQSQNLTRLDRHRKAVVALVAAPAAVADLPQFILQGAQVRIIEFGGVVEDQHHPFVGSHAIEGVTHMRLQHRLVRHRIAVHQAIQRFQTRRFFQLVRQRTPRMGRHLIGHRHQSLRPPLIAQPRPPEVFLAETRRHRP